MAGFRFTLVADGRTDQVLVHPLKWLLVKLGVPEPLDGVWADFSTRADPPKVLAERVRRAVKEYPCDLLFIHRDAERELRQSRIEEIRRALHSPAAEQVSTIPSVCVVPVHMTEAWFLFDEAAIRLGAGNPAGKVSLGLPAFSKIEDFPDPKDVLHKALQQACELRGRRLRGFDVCQAFYEMADQITDFSPLRRLPAFQALEADLRRVVKNAGWV
jgi:hypothetical protein